MASHAVFSSFEHFGQEADGSHFRPAVTSAFLVCRQGQELPQARAFLSNVKDRGHKIYAKQLTVLATSNAGRLRCLKHLGPFFDDIFISDEVGAHKPSTDFFEKIADQVNDFHPDSALMIGDSLTADIQGGNNAGIDSIWF
ncbi:MAG: HAD-IA family hydrolase [Streptococcus salivarius]